ncbi:MAG TPA: hypothetical protein VL728_19465 [Cyclobacteriaceae bacterium]|jgi:hypothetical protein|nr:hypothetical protein [Cyclobacteriaceae bacterium]
MSWLDRIKHDLIITTGDGKKYKPEWINATKSKEYNIADFDFPEKAGTLRRRSMPRGRKYRLELYFQGEDHLDQSEDFETSADDSRPWRISHPFWGIIYAQPDGLEFDNTVHNVSKITCNVMETILDNNPVVTHDPADSILQANDSLMGTTSTSFAEKVPSPSVHDVNVMSAATANTFNSAYQKIKKTSDAQNYYNLFQSANSAIINASNDPLFAMQKIQAMINAPFQFADSAQNRITLLLNQFNKLRTSISTLLSPSSKRIYEAMGNTIISGLCACAVTPRTKDYNSVSDYNNRGDAFDVIGKLTDNFNLYLSDLDSLQTPNGGEADSYIPDYDSLSGLNDMVSLTISNLFQIAVNAKQERTIILEKDSNVVLLAHRFYGLQADDTTIDDFIKQNNIGLNELMILNKGRKIIYYK